MELYQNCRVKHHVRTGLTGLVLKIKLIDFSSLLFRNSESLPEQTYDSIFFPIFLLSAVETAPVIQPRLKIRFLHFLAGQKVSDDWSPVCA